MKFLKLLGLSALLAFTLPVIGQEDTSTAPPPKVAFVQTDTLDAYQVGDSMYYLIAQNLNGVLVTVKKIAVEVQAAPPKNAGDWISLILKLLLGGTLASIVSQGIKIFNDLKTLVGKLPRGEWIVLAVSTVIGGVWLYLETKFVAFDFSTLFFRIAGVYMVAVLVWRSGLSNIFKKKEAPSPVPPAPPGMP